MTRTACRALVAALAALVAGPAVAADDKPVTPFNGKSLDGWKLKGKDESKSKWRVGKAALADKDPSQLAVTEAPGRDGELVNAGSGGVDIFTEQKFGDCTVEVEFMVPKGSNSGVYLMGEYEVQVFDSFGKEKIGMGDLGAIYS